MLWGLFLCFIGALPAQGQTRIDIDGSIEWARMRINAAVRVDLPSAGIRLPTGRIHAEEIISDEYPYLMRPHLLSLPVDSGATLGDVLARGEFSLAGADTVSLTARKVPPALSTDLNVMSAGYTLNLAILSRSLLRHSRPKEPMRVLAPPLVRSYTGIIIIASEVLPVHGRNTAAKALPCIFPKIWDTRMNLIYERNMFDPETEGVMARYVGPESVFYPAPSGLDEELAALVGPDPLRIIAQGVFGIRPTDPIIDYEDALLIVSSEDNRRLLREGKVAIVLDSGVLTSPLRSP
jgi:hypothetical protein